MHRVYILKNCIQHYVWGSDTLMAQALGKKYPTTQLEAEYWMGAHPEAPSCIRQKRKWKRLDEWIQEESDKKSLILGEIIAQKWGKLPFLLKILAVADPLSFQVHPNLTLAQNGYRSEDEKKIDKKAKNRSYKDANHKPEMVLALSDFLALKGFRSVAEILAFLKKLNLSTINALVSRLEQDPSPAGMEKFFTELVSLSEEDQQKAVQEAKKAVAKRSCCPEFDWLEKLAERYPKDILVLAPLLLHFKKLQVDEAMFIHEGEPHVYLQGLAIEIMATSDNVLRGGLTTKYKNLPELLKALRWQADGVNLIQPKQSAQCPQEVLYETAAEEFVLSKISLQPDASYQSPQERNVEILLFLNGKAKLTYFVSTETGSKKKVSRYCTQGKSVLVPASVGEYWIEGDATCYKATVPLCPKCVS